MTSPSQEEPRFCDEVGCVRKVFPPYIYCVVHQDAHSMPLGVPNEPSDDHNPNDESVYHLSEDEIPAPIHPHQQVSAIGDELDSLYRPEITDLERNEYHGNDRPVIYLADAKRVLEEQTKLALEVAKNDVEFAIRWNQPLEQVLWQMNQRLEASIKERSEDDTPRR